MSSSLKSKFGYISLALLNLTYSNSGHDYFNFRLTGVSFKSGSYLRMAFIDYEPTPHGAINNIVTRNTDNEGRTIIEI